MINYSYKRGVRKKLPVVILTFNTDITYIIGGLGEFKELSTPLIDIKYIIAEYP